MTSYHKHELKSATLVSVIFNSLEEEILMSDNYGDKGFLNLISKLGGGDGGGGGTPIHYQYGYVPPNGVVILKLLI